MEKPLTFIECFRQALARHAVPWHAPDIQRFIKHRCKEEGLLVPKGRQTVYNWMDPEKKPSTESYLLLSKVLDVSMRWLVEGTGDMRRSVKLTPRQAEVLAILKDLGEINPEARDYWVSQGRKQIELLVPKGVNNPFRR